MVQKVLNEILERQKERFISLYEICNFLSRELGTNPKDILIYLHGLEKQNRNRETISLYDIDNLGFYQPSKTTLHKIVNLNPVNFDFNKNKNKIEKFFIDADEFASLSFIKDSHIFPTNHKAIKLINDLRIEGKLRKSLAKLTHESFETSQEWQDNLLTKMEILLLENAKLNKQLLQSPNKTIAELKQHNNELRDFIDSKLDSVSNDLLKQAQETNRIILEQGLKEIRNPSLLEDKLDEIIERTPNNDNHVTLEQTTSDRTKDISQPNSESNTLMSDELLFEMKTNPEIYNLKQKILAKSNNLIAQAIKRLDVGKKLTKDDLAKFILPYSKDMALFLGELGNVKSIPKADINTIRNNHLNGLEFKNGSPSIKDKERERIDLTFDRTKLTVTDN